MRPAILNPPHARRAHDHRLRERVVGYGASAVAKHVQIPRSTVSTWRRRGLRPLVTTESVGHDLQYALDSSARWEERARLLAAVVRETRLRSRKTPKKPQADILRRLDLEAAALAIQGKQVGQASFMPRRRSNSWWSFLCSMLSRRFPVWPLRAPRFAVPAVAGSAGFVPR